MFKLNSSIPFVVTGRHISFVRVHARRTLGVHPHRTLGDHCDHRHQDSNAAASVLETLPPLSMVAVCTNDHPITPLRDGAFSTPRGGCWV